MTRVGSDEVAGGRGRGLAAGIRLERASAVECQSDLVVEADSGWRGRMQGGQREAGSDEGLGAERRLGAQRRPAGGRAARACSRSSSRMKSSATGSWVCYRLGEASGELHLIAGDAGVAGTRRP